MYVCNMQANSGMRGIGPSGDPQSPEEAVIGLLMQAGRRLRTRHPTDSPNAPGTPMADRTSGDSGGRRPPGTAGHSLAEIQRRGRGDLATHTVAAQRDHRHRLVVVVVDQRELTTGRRARWAATSRSTGQSRHDDVRRANQAAAVGCIPQRY